MNSTDSEITVLCVNDDHEVLELLSGGLERESDRLDVRTADDVAAGLRAFRDDDVDCIVSDYHMPDRTGVAFLEAVRAEDPDLPFIMFTNTGDEAVASEAIQAGVTDYIVRQTVGDQYDFVAEKVRSHVEYRRAEQRAAETDRQLRELATVTDDVLFMFSADWTDLQFINDAYETLFGDSVETIRANPQSFLDHVHADDLDRVRAAMEHVAAGQSQQVEYRVHQSDGIQIWVESQCKPVRDDDGVVQSVVGFTREITERKHREQDLASKNEQLEQFAATVAHDLRNPLTILDGHLEFAAREYESDHIETSLDAVGRMSDLIDDLLSLAQQGAGIDERTDIELAELVAASDDAVALSAATVVVEESATLHCDSSRLKEAIQNLLRNAVEHGTTTPETAGPEEVGGVTITVGLLTDDAGEPTGFYVEDDGDGIPADEQDRIFERSFTTAETGTGFGLSIVDQIIGAHGWTIEATDGSDGGARFEVTDVDFAS